ncbi:D(1)-like dopamine receptor [Stylophora pistillata]|uniref:D(1)-like dopamine receptor n=1 Tax=Stylophora pistillata TaxID=50429 RepID=UPI000C040F9E|nr:D(1)-like dopamine receptor [Stylophora pistillata]
MANDTSIQCSFLIYHKIEKTDSLTTVSVVASVWNGMLFPVALAANGLVCTAILKHRELRVRASNTLLLLLSMSDFFVAFAVQPLYTLRRFLELKERYICWVMLSYRVLWHLSIGTSFIILFVIACERYIALFYTFKYKQIITVPRLVIFTGVFVASWTIFVISRFFGLSTAQYYTAAISFIVTYVTFIIFVYIRIFRLARRHHFQISSTLTAQSSTTARESKITKTTAYIVGAVLTCYSPLLMSLVAVKFFDDKIFHYYVFPVTDCFVFCNSALNPLIYCWRNSDLRQCIRMLLQFCERKETNSPLCSLRHKVTAIPSSNT